MKITKVRLTEKEGREALQRYIFAGWPAPFRVPRGVDPKLVSRFIAENVDEDTKEVQSDEGSPGVFNQTLEVMRFYESADVLPHFAPMIVSRPVHFSGDLAIICEMFGDLGQPAEAERAAAYFNENLVPLPGALESSKLMLKTLLALAPAGSIQPFEARVNEEVSRLAPAQRSSEEAMRDYDKIAAVQRNEIPRTRALIEYKKQLLLEKPSERRHALVDLYFGRGRVLDPYLEVWAARLLRREAMEIGSKPALDEFGKVIDEVPLESVGKERKYDVMVTRAAEAIKYFGGSLTASQREKIGRAKGPTLNFLDDGL